MLYLLKNKFFNKKIFIKSILNKMLFRKHNSLFFNFKGLKVPLKSSEYMGDAFNQIYGGNYRNDDIDYIVKLTSYVTSKNILFISEDYGYLLLYATSVTFPKRNITIILDKKLNFDNNCKLFRDAGVKFNSKILHKDDKNIYFSNITIVYLNIISLHEINLLEECDLLYLDNYNNITKNLQLIKKIKAKVILFKWVSDWYSNQQFNYICSFLAKQGYFINTKFTNNYNWQIQV